MPAFPLRAFCAFLSSFLCLGLFVCLDAYAATPTTPIEITIGNAYATLNGPWRFHPGDDMAWAAAGYDDSAWAPMDLTPPDGATDPITGGSGFAVGWTSKGYPKLTGYAWYRIRVTVRSAAGDTLPPLALRMPLDLDDAYQVYLNGRRIGEFGNFHPDGSVSFLNAQPRAFGLPESLPAGPITIAIRVWMDKATPFMAVDAGGLHGPPLLGQAQAMDTMLAMSWNEVDRTMVSYVVRTIILGVVAALGYIFFALDRREKLYLWLALACTSHALNLLISILGYYVTWMPMVPETVVTDVLLSPLNFVLWTIFWAYWFDLPELRRMHWVVWSLLVLLVAGVAMLRAPLYGGLVPVSVSGWLLPLTEALKLAFGVVLLWIVVRGIRLRGVEGWLALIPVLMMPTSLYGDELSVLHINVPIVVHGMPFGLNCIGLALMLAAIFVLMLRRFVRSLHEKQHLESEMEQARQVQQVLIPEDLPPVPGFVLASEYRPAQEVGGDFFQILPTANGGVLAIIGDVSGKGTAAAMTVSLLVGTVRTIARFTVQPGEILAELNQRMIGRSNGGFTTCLVLRVDRDGTLTIANAGHLPPLLDGRELPTENELPLGIIEGVRYTEVSARIEAGQQLTLLSDGVVEAQGRGGELFGFARTAGIAAESAAKIADAAQAFGQIDDITVVTVTKEIQPEAEVRMPASTPVFSGA